MRLSAAPLLFALAISGCGPIYSTEYRFTPPAGGGGSRCVDQCEEAQDVCREIQSSRKESCEAENQHLMERCNDKIAREKNRGPKWTECGRQITCDFPESRCDEGYRGCYRSCGGTVVEEQVCVANCGD